MEFLQDSSSSTHRNLAGWEGVDVVGELPEAKKKKKKIQKSLYYDVIINLFNLFSLFVYYYTHYIAYLLSYTYHQFTNLSIHLLLLLFLQGAYSTVM